MTKHVCVRINVYFLRTCNSQEIISGFILIKLHWRILYSFNFTISSSPPLFTVISYKELFNLHILTELSQEALSWLLSGDPNSYPPTLWEGKEKTPSRKPKACLRHCIWMHTSHESSEFDGKSYFGEYYLPLESPCNIRITLFHFLVLQAIENFKKMK